MQGADLTECALHYKFGGLIVTVCAMICLLKMPLLICQAC